MLEYSSFSVLRRLVVICATRSNFLKNDLECLMFINDNISVLHVFQIIESASHEILQAYDAEVKMIVHKLKKMLIAQKNNTSKFSIEQVFFRKSIKQWFIIFNYKNPATFDSFSRKNGCNVVCLIQILENTATQIRAYFEKPEIDAINDKLNSCFDDSRVNDFKLMKNNSFPRIKFRTVLGQRFLALKYISWKTQIFDTFKVLELADNSKHSQHRKSGKIGQYLQTNRNRFVNTKIVRTNIERGIKFLVFEKLTDTIMISIIVNFCASKFRSIKYNEMRSLGTRLNTIKWIETLTNQKTDWFQKCQKYYDDQFI